MSDVGHASPSAGDLLCAASASTNRVCVDAKLQGLQELGPNDGWVLTDAANAVRMTSQNLHDFRFISVCPRAW